MSTLFPKPDMLTMAIVGPVLDEIVSEQPDTIIASLGCKYASNYRPSCLVGHMLYRLGWTSEELHNLDSADTDGSGTGIETLVDYGYIDADSTTTRFLTVLQDYQDAQNRWEDALSIARGRVAQ